MSKNNIATNPLCLILSIIVVIAAISRAVEYAKDQLSGRTAWEKCMSRASKEWNMKYAEAAWREKGALSRLDRIEFYEKMCGNRP